MAVFFAGGLGVSPATAAPAVRGLDVSDHQRSIDWRTVRADGAQFAYVKATEGTGFVNPDFASQYTGSYRAGLIRGAYHFALPNRSSGAAQASYFVAHGGDWTADGRTLPGALDIEPNPYGAKCYGLSRSALVAWIAGFVRTYHALTTRWPVIYTTRRWWATCTGDYSGFDTADPLWIAGSSAASSLPGGWNSYTFWQYSSAGEFPGDQDIFNGVGSKLLQLAAHG